VAVFIRPTAKDAVFSAIIRLGLDHSYSYVVVLLRVKDTQNRHLVDTGAGQNAVDFIAGVDDVHHVE
jgi:hypothetical protein